MAHNQKIICKLILRATITNTSPLLIATGKGETTDFEVIRDGKGKPFIPAAGFAGMLRASFDALKLNSSEQEQKKFLWGTEGTVKDNTNQSHIIIDDLKMISDSKIALRDGVAINHQTGIAKDKSKYDYELLEPDAKFELNAEITLREGFNSETFLQFLQFMIEQGKGEMYQQGAFKTNGFGMLKWEEIEVYGFKFPENGAKWFEYLEGTMPKSIYPFENLTPLPQFQYNTLKIEGIFEIKNTLIIGTVDAGTDIDKEKAPDKTHLKNSKKDSLLTAKSLRGPIRHRTLRILNTLGKADADCIVDELFGFVNEDEKKAQKGRFKTFETTITGANDSQIQPRIKIDRFTGGTVEHALMQTQPLWHDKEEITLKIEIECCKEYEAGLMLLVMKDLMNEDLPIGGEKAIGRGLLKGQSLHIKGQVDNKNCGDISFDAKGITDKSKIEIINNWLSKL